VSSTKNWLPKEKFSSIGPELGIGPRLGLRVDIPKFVLRFDLLPLQVLTLPEGSAIKKFLFFDGGSGKSRLNFCHRAYPFND